VPSLDSLPSTVSTNDHFIEQQDFCHLPGLTESELGENTLGVVLDSLLPTYKEVLSPIPLPTYRGISPSHSAWFQS
jgi:hypothetical protein